LRAKEIELLPNEIDQRELVGLTPMPNPAEDSEGPVPGLPEAGPRFTVLEGSTLPAKSIAEKVIV
jgi:hypothetical protein